VSAEPTPDLNLSGPRRDALVAVLHAAREGRRAWRANHSRLDGRPLLVHHRTVDWLEKQGLVDLQGDMVVLTPAGRVAAEKADARARAKAG
jgi:hypothetical protein